MQTTLVSQNNFVTGAAMEFVAAADITGVAIARELCEVISVSGEVSVEDHTTLAAGFALSLGIEQDAGMYFILLK